MKKNDKFCFFDIETLPHDYTVTAYIKEKKQIIIYANTFNTFDHQQVIKGILKLNKGLVEKVSFTDRYGEFRRWILWGYQQDGMYRAGWNSKRFDVPIVFLCSSGDPQDARRIANDIIQRNIYTTKLTDSKGQRISYKAITNLINCPHHIDVALLNEKSGDSEDKVRTPASLKTVSAYAQLNIIDNAVTRLDFSNWSVEKWALLPNDLKELVEPNGALSSKGLVELLIYNPQDVINTALLAEEPEYVSTFETKKALLEKFKVNENGNVASPSDTSARISSLILSKNGTIKFKDKKAVDFMFPLPDGTYIDLLEKLNNEKVIPHDVYVFYSNIRGRDMSTKKGLIDFAKANDEYFNVKVKERYQGNEQFAYIKPAKPFDHPKSRTCSTLTVPYYDKDFKPISSYNTFSLGGSHGATSKNSVDYPFVFSAMFKFRINKEKRDKSLTGRKVLVYDKSIEKVTTDNSAWGIDFESFYPTFLVKLGVYVAPDGSDVYDEIRTSRLKIKNSLPENVVDWTLDDEKKNREQKDSKLIINSATGASNTRKPHALLKLDNKIVSMRAMGNLLIYAVGTEFVRKLDASVVSTNTDGIEITFDNLPSSEKPSKDEIQALANKITKEYGFVLKPERLDRFVAKDSNNRLEWHGSTINKVAGKLGKGFFTNDRQGNPKPHRVKLDSKLDHPIITDLAVIDFINSHKHFLDPNLKVFEPTTRKGQIDESTYNQTVLEWFEKWLQNKASTAFEPVDWLLFSKSNKKRKFFLDGKVTQDNNRYIYSSKLESKTITSTLNGKPAKITGWTFKKVVLLNRISDLKELKANDLEIKPYAKWCYKTLLTWLNSEQTSIPKSQSAKNTLKMVSERLNKKSEQNSEKSSKKGTFKADLNSNNINTLDKLKTPEKSVESYLNENVNSSNSILGLYKKQKTTE